MFEGEDIAFNGLEVCSYRHLQGMAKKMGLPSNVKKVHLIEMIRAKKYCTEMDLNAIIDRIKMERKVNAQAKKKKAQKRPYRVQGMEISSTSNSQSPPIMLTPKRPSEIVIEYSPDITQTLMKYQPMNNILRTGTSILQPLKRHIDSDRVLRSFNSGRRPNYRIMEQSDCMINTLSQDMQEMEQDRVQQVRQERAYQSVTNVTIQQARPINAMVLNADRHLVPMSRNLNIPKPAKRQRKLSGIYALEPRDKPDYVPTVGFRRSDGRVTKINAVIQKPLCNALLPKKHAFVKRATLTVQDMINYKIDHPNEPNRAIEGPSSSRLFHEIDCKTFDYQYNEPTQFNIQTDNISQNTPEPSSITEITGRKELNKSRKVYKACPCSKTNANKGWNYVEYQEHETTDRGEWIIYDINGQPLDKNTEHSRNLQTNKDLPVSTNYKVTQGRITQPVSRDYQVEYQRFNQELTDHRSGIRRQTLHKVADRYVSNAISDANAQEITSKNTQEGIKDDRSNSKDPILESAIKDKNYARSGENHDMTAKSDAKNQTRLTEKNIVSYNFNKDQRCTQELSVRIVDVRSDAKYQRFNQPTSDENIYARSDLKDRYNKETNKSLLNKSNTKDQQYNQKVTVRHIDPARSDSNYQESNLGTAFRKNMVYAKSDIKDQRCHQQIYLKNMDYVRSVAKNQRQDNNYARCDQPTNDVDMNQYPNMASMTDVFPNEDYSESLQMRGDSNFTVYYHKIRAEQIQRSQVRDYERLPRINDAFSQFNDVQYRGLLQPLYVQVSAESERVLPDNSANNTCMIENLYNFKNQFITNPPVLMIATTNTFCTYSTKTVTTAIAQPAIAQFHNDDPYARADTYRQIDKNRSNDYLRPEYRPRSFGCYEVLSSSTNSLETTNSQELGANVTIPEMVEDALELISQDGDYMERIGMDVRMQCILCEWAGPKMILEYHIKKDHSHAIQQQNSNEWSILLTLGELCSTHAWTSQLVQCGAELYVLSAKHTDTDAVLLALSMISPESDITKRGRITVYNKISGRPYTFESEIQPLPDSMPYEYGLDCLTLDVANLDLVPNSANLRLVNGELVGSSGKTVIGQPELNDIEIVVYVKLID